MKTLSSMGITLKIDNVDDLLVDILGVPNYALNDAIRWVEITEIFEKAISSAKDLLIIDAETDRYEDCQPYIQICYEDDGAMTIEAVSSHFLDPGLSPDAQNTLVELGWQVTEDPKLPNYFQFLHNDEASSREIAELFTKTFRNVYGISPTDTIEIRARKGIWPSGREEEEYE